MGTGAGLHSFGNTYGSKRIIASGDAVFRSRNQNYFNYIKNRKDIDPDGKFDVVAHGTKYTISVKHGKDDLEIDSRVAAQLIKSQKGYHKGQTIRLLSCSTGAIDNGFAQNLANKLGVKVEAPTDVFWATPSGHHFIAGRDSINPHYPDLHKKGHMKIFYPGGKKI